MEGQRQYYRGQYSDKKMVRNRRDLDHDQSTDVAIVDVIDKLKKSQLVNGGYCQQGNSNGSNSYESVEIYVKRTSQIPRHDHAAFKYQQMESANKVKLEDDEELFISRMISHEKLRSEKWFNELQNKKEFMLKILQEMKSQGVQNIYDEEFFIRMVLEKRSEFVGIKSNSHGSNQSLVISKDKVSVHGCQQNSEHVSEYAAASTEVINSVDQLSDRELSFIKEMMSFEKIKELSINEDFIKELIREMKMQGLKDICNKESFIKCVSEKKSKMQETSNQTFSSQIVSNGHGSWNGYNEAVVAAYEEFSNSEVSFVNRMISSQKINWKREFSSQKDKEAFMFSIIREMKREGIKNICDEEYFVKRIHHEMKRIHQEEKHKQMQRINGGGGYQIVRQEIITQYDNGGNYQRMGGYQAGGAYGGAGKMINGYGGDYNYEDDFHGQAMQQKKMIMGQHKYHQGYAYGKYYK